MSAGGLVRADVSRSAAPLAAVARGYAHYIVGKSTKYYSVVVANNTNRELRVAVTR